MNVVLLYIYQECKCSLFIGTHFCIYWCTFKNNVPKGDLEKFLKIWYHFRIKKDYYKGCPGHKLWILAVNLVSQLLLSINSALNFFLYCIMSPMFRRELGNRTFYKLFIMWLFIWTWFIGLLIGRLIQNCKVVLDSRIFSSFGTHNSQQIPQETDQPATHNPQQKWSISFLGLKLKKLRFSVE